MVREGSMCAEKWAISKTSRHSANKYFMYNLGIKEEIEQASGLDEKLSGKFNFLEN